ncbi:4'-phosphopantetheinyl transferase [Dictyobacter vulcani]|uniref:4'-phosphopantetheinyl transferase n=1 Tax=Dictyobacter vulcani TaxID=2607529 RepID=A0A5J4KPB2_9CHLR|nr:4'-phosphopantetheinyl transferase superfamily protein [Dictyobacter vulcani]GER91224.1 4'-phosphopantetheinyl transferase [Dictyobacter vulcani]
MIEDIWQPPPSTLKLEQSAVHVWRADLRASQESVERFRHILSPEEQARAQRFYFERDRYRWTIAHGILRILLARYTGQDPRALRFQVNAYGKPSLVQPDQQPRLEFNLSHSHEMALYAFTWQRQIGVDVEYMRDDIGYEELARHSFSPTEQAVLLSLATSQQKAAFFKCWSSKEAYIKGRGMGLSLELNLFDVALAPDKPVALLASREDPAEVQRWSMAKLEPGADYAGALAVEGPLPDISCWQWNGTL